MNEEQLKEFKDKINEALKCFSNNLSLIQTDTPNRGAILILIGEICGLIKKLSELEIEYLNTQEVRIEMAEINSLANEMVAKFRINNK